ncbi:MAG: adenylyltransferase/cytidyltransferase family protein [Rickettsiales bacterium]|nr:adenylyltransferase/cytidyltransferase family protein [Rickettsiales bacterium]
MSTEREPIVGLYAGSFDPITRGHMGIICEAINKLDKLVIGIGKNPDKKGMFSNEKREEIIKAAIEDFKNEVIAKGADATPSEKRAVERLNSGACEVAVESYDGLTVDFAIQHNAHQLIRGLRPIGDFESEQSLADINKRIANKSGFDISTSFIPTPDTRYIFASSSLIRTLSKKPEVISDYLYPSTAEAVAQHISATSRVSGRGGAAGVAQG